MVNYPSMSKGEGAMKHIGFRIKELREARQLTVQELSDQARVPRLEKIEAGYIEPTWGEECRLKEVLEVTWLELTGND